MGEYLSIRYTFWKIGGGVKVHASVRDAHETMCGLSVMGDNVTPVRRDPNCALCNNCKRIMSVENG